MSRKKPAVKTKTKRMPKKKAQKKKKSQRVGTQEFSLKRPAVRSGRQSGDLLGLSGREGADSESVTELLEEGNPFEAEVVSGVEAADSERKSERMKCPRMTFPANIWTKTEAWRAVRV